MIEAVGIFKSYNKKEIIKNLDVTIQKNVLVAITGESGKGKTTLLNILGLLEKPDSGTVTVNGIANPKGSQLRLLRRNILSYMFQNYGLIDEKTVEENLKVSLAYRKVKDEKLEINNALSYVGMDGTEKRKIYELSGGEQQRIALARVIIKNADYIFADEPTGNLDIRNRDVVFKLLKNLVNSGKSVILVTHDNELSKQADYNISL